MNDERISDLSVLDVENENITNINLDNTVPSININFNNSDFECIDVKIS